MKDKPVKMNPIKVRFSCPDCGFIPDGIVGQETAYAEIYHGKGWNCPRCKCHYSGEDFDREHEEKIMGLNHKRATADLSGEDEL